MGDIDGSSFVSDEKRADFVVTSKRSKPRARARARARSERNRIRASIKVRANHRGRVRDRVRDKDKGKQRKVEKRSFIWLSRRCQDPLGVGEHESND